ncbi:MAG: type II toxin-antitoxin system HicA family toxin [Chloroflexi bacterium]|nr:type II toxin-antitoxin system HicA family toxin [Chloroflexota bacterium]
MPAVRPRQVLAALQRAGWVIHRQAGSHISLRKEGHPFVVTVPVHSRDLPRGTLRGILADAGLTVEDFLRLL